MTWKRGVLVAAVAVGITAPAATAADGTAVAKRTAVAATTQHLTAGATDDRIAASLLAATERATSPQPVAATIPAMTSPTQGSTVSGAITLSVTSSAPTVRFGLASTPWTQDVAVVGGVASTTFETYGLAGAQRFTARDCDGTGCSTDATGVDVTVDNAPVAIAQPTDGAAVGTSVAVTVTAPGGGVRFLLDGSPAGQAATSPYSTTIDTSGLAAGPHTVSAMGCSSDFARCDTAHVAQVSIDVQNKVAPVIASVTPGLFSPGNDGRKDTATVAYDLDSDQSVAWRVLDTSGRTVRGPVTIGAQAAGPHTFAFNGKDSSGSYLADGAYTVRLETSRTVGGTEVTGAAEHAVEVDRTAPTATRVAATPGTFYPVKDGYLDKATIKASLGEDVESLRADLVSSHGKRVRTLDVGAQRAGTRKLVWDGRTRSGRVVAAGRYAVKLTLVDAAGNKTVIGGTSITVSDKKLVKKTGVQTMTPKSNIVGHVIGRCSRVAYPAKKAWPGSFVYLSNYNLCGAPTDEQLLAFTRHAIKVPAAIKYGNVRVDTYGARTVPGYPDIGFVFYEKPSGDISDQGAVLRASERWHQGDSVPGSTFINSKHVFRWWAGTSDMNFYSVKSFRVTYAYFVLA